jgi:hypothetical protein
MRISRVFSFVFVLLIYSLKGIAQGPEHSPKLTKENGFNAFKIGAKYSLVKDFLLKDTLNRSLSFDAQDITSGFFTRMFLANLKKPGYSEFLGLKIDRIEVWFSMDMNSEDEHAEDVISDVNIYFKKVSDKNTGDFFAKLFEVYGGAYPVLDFPEKDDELITWYSEDVMMDALSFYGGEKKPKRDYFEIHFFSAKGG